MRATTAELRLVDATGQWRAGAGHLAAPTETWLQEVALQGVPVVTADAREARLTVPVRTGRDELVGALTVSAPAPRTFSAGDIGLLTTLADEVAARLTEERRATELAATVDRLELALDSADIGRFDLELATGRLLWDRRLMVLFGYDPATFVPHLDSFTSRVHPDDRDRVAAVVERAASTGGGFDVEYRVARPDGRLVWITARGRAATDARTGAQHMLGAAWESTRIREARDQVARVLETMTDAFFSLDREWRFTYVNSEAERVLLRPAHELVGHGIWEEFPAAVGTRFESAYRGAVESGRTVSFEEYYPEPLNAWFEVRAWPGPDGLSVYFQDVSARRRAEAEREAAVAAREQAVLEREQAVSEADAASARLTLLGEMTRALVSTLDVDEALDRLARLVVPRVADWAAVTLLDSESRLRHSVARHRDPDQAEAVERFARVHTRDLTEESRSVRVARGGEPVLIPHVDLEAVAAGTTNPEVVALLAEMGLASLVVVPLQGRQEVLGVLVLAGGPDREPFDERDLQMATEIGQRAGLVVDNARLYERQRQAAEVLQRSLLTRLPEPADLEIVARYLPSAQEAQVGGDWYDAFVQPNGATVLAIGDVMGHDMSAAAAMGQVRNILRGVGYDSDDSPAGLLRRVDAAIRGLAVDTLATAVVARLEDPVGLGNGGRVLRWSNAGHPPPLLFRADGTVSTLSEFGDLLLGLEPGSGREDHIARLEPGDTLLLYTDGLVERRDSPLEHGLARLRQAVAALAGKPLPLFCDELLARVLPAAREDDVALVAVRVRGPATSPAQTADG